MGTVGSDSESIFGEQGSTGISAGDYIDRIASSEVVSNTIVDTVYDDEGNVTVDPLGTSISLSEAEQAEILDAINAYLETATDEEREEVERQMIAAAALINMNVQVDGSGAILGQ